LLSIRDIRVRGLTIDKWGDIDTISNILKDPEATKKYDTLFIDSATELARKCCENVLEQRIGIVAARGKSLDTIFEDQMTLEDWGVVKGRIDRMFRMFRDMPFNVVFTALEHNKTEKETGMDKAMPLLYPQSMSEQVPGYFDEVYRMKQAANKEGAIIRWWETIDDGKQMAKSRLNVFGKEIKPDWTQIFNVIKGGMNGSGKSE
jgi:hypothetical protein